MATANAATNYLERRILDFLFKNNSLSFSSPGDSIYVGLATAVSAAETGSLTEATFGGYGRKRVNHADWTLTSESDNTQTCKNTNAIEFNESTGTDNTISHVFIATDETASLDVVGSGGNVLFIGKLDANKVISTGDIFRINALNLTIEMK